MKNVNNSQVRSDSKWMIDYASGKSQRKVSQYTLATTVKFTANSTANLGVKPTAVSGAKSTDLIKLKEKPKQTVVVADCATAFDFFMSTKNKRLLA